MNTHEQIKWFDKSRTSNTGNWVARGLNAAGSIGFGYLIGPLSYRWTGLSDGWNSLFGAITIALAFDYMLIVWQSRTRTAQANEQYKMAHEMAEASLYSSTIASAIFVLLQMSAWMPSIIPYVEIIKGILVALTVAVISAQMLYNVWYLMADPEITYDRIKAVEHANDQSLKLERLGKQNKKKHQMIAKYMDLTATLNARKEAIQELREMGYTGVIDFSDYEDLNRDDMNSIALPEFQQSTRQQHQQSRPPTLEPALIYPTPSQAQPHDFLPNGQPEVSQNGRN